MRSRLHTEIFLGVAVLITVELSAQPWVALHPRNRGMGNAGVASAEGGATAYWNPANLARGSEEMFGFSFKSTSVNAHGFVDAAAKGNVIQVFDELLGLFGEGGDFEALQAAFDAGTANAEQVKSVFSIIDTIADLDDPGNGLTADIGGAMDIKMGNFAVSYRFISLISGSTFVDTTTSALANDGANDLSNVAQGLGADDAPSNAFAVNEIVPALQGLGLTLQEAQELAFQAEEALGANINDADTQELILEVIGATNLLAGGTLAANESFVLLRGIAMQEIAFAYGMPLFDGKIRVGIAPKVIVGKTFFQTFDITDSTLNDGDDVADELRNVFDKNSETTTRFTIDAGVAWEPFPFLEFGLGAKNLIPTDFSFKQPTGKNITIDDFELEPQLRGGVLLRPLGWKWLKLTGDFDLTKNSNSLFPGFQERIVGGGVEISPSLWIFQLAIRAGAFDNVEASGEGLTYTGGLGIRTGIIYLGAQIQMADKTIDIESSGDDVPARAGFSVNLGINVRF